MIGVSGAPNASRFAITALDRGERTSSGLAGLPSNEPGRMDSASG
jgi:hypothetical protein